MSVKTYVEQRPFLVHLFVYIVFAISITLLYASESHHSATEHNIQSRIVTILEQDPCGQVPVPKLKCQKELVKIVKALDHKTACIVVEKAGLKCKVKNPASKPGASPSGSSQPPSQEPQQPSGGIEQGPAGESSPPAASPPQAPNQNNGGENNPAPPGNNGGTATPPQSETDIIIQELNQDVQQTHQIFCSLNPTLC